LFIDLSNPSNVDFPSPSKGVGVNVDTAQSIINENKNILKLVLLNNLQQPRNLEAAKDDELAILPLSKLKIVVGR
jgi:hypothetical protein